MTDARDITVALAPQQWTPDQVKQYVDVLAEEQRIAIERRTETSRREIDAVAQLARVDAAALRAAVADLKDMFTRVTEERQRAVAQANDEREKAAEALRRELSQSILAALQSADMLERERIAVIDGSLERYQTATHESVARLLAFREHDQSDVKEQVLAAMTAVTRELTAQASAQKEAVIKAENAANDKFASHNGLIEQMRQQAVKAEGTLATQSALFLPRETFEVYKQAVEQRLNTMAGVERGESTVRQQGVTANGQRLQVWAIIEGLAIGLLSIVITIAIATHGFAH